MIFDVVDKAEIVAFSNQDYHLIFHSNALTWYNEQRWQPRWRQREWPHSHPDKISKVFRDEIFVNQIRLRPPWPSEQKFQNKNRAQAICRAKVESHNPGIFSRLEKEEQKTLLTNGGWWTGGERGTKLCKYLVIVRGRDANKIPWNLLLQRSSGFPPIHTCSSRLRRQILV